MFDAFNHCATAVEGAVNEAINTATPYVKESVQKLVGRKRSHSATTTTTTTTTTIPSVYDVKRPKININSLIDGSGIDGSIREYERVCGIPANQ